MSSARLALGTLVVVMGIGSANAALVAKRSEADKTLTDSDRRSFQAMGLAHLHAATVVTRTLPKLGDLRARLRGLVQAPERLEPSGVCDKLEAAGAARAACSGRVDGPLGKVAVRTSIGAELTERADGSLHLVLHNATPLEAKGVFSWSPVVETGHLVLSYDLFPDQAGWRTEARVGVEMKAHEGSANDVCDSMLKVESWLSRDLERP